MHPGNPAGHLRVFDAMAVLRIVEHDLPGPATALNIYLEEDGALGLGDANLVLVDEAFDDERVKEGTEEGDQVGIIVVTDGALELCREEIHTLRAV